MRHIDDRENYQACFHNYLRSVFFKPIRHLGNVRCTLLSKKTSLGKYHFLRVHFFTTFEDLQDKKCTFLVQLKAYFMRQILMMHKNKNLMIRLIFHVLIIFLIFDRVIHMVFVKKMKFLWLFFVLPLIEPAH